jgi:hypothetical protein
MPEQYRGMHPMPPVAHHPASLTVLQPCQCLFVAPCSHTWHYRCIRSLLTSPSYPIFICPNCRAAADLEAEIEDPEEWEQLDSDEGGPQQEGARLQAPSANALDAPPRKSRESVRSSSRVALSPSLPQQQQQQQQQSPPLLRTEVPEVTMLLDDDPPAQLPLPASAPIDISASAVSLPLSSSSSNTTSNPMPIPAASAAQQRILASGSGGSDGRRGSTRTPSPTGAPVLANGHEGPITPRNDAGPWVFDGSGVRLRADGVGSGNAHGSGSGIGAVNSLEAAVTQPQQQQQQGSAGLGSGRLREDDVS